MALVPPVINIYSNDGSVLLGTYKGWTIRVIVRTTEIVADVGDDIVLLALSGWVDFSGLATSPNATVADYPCDQDSDSNIRELSPGVDNNFYVVRERKPATIITLDGYCRLDMSEDTVTPEKLVRGEIAHTNAGDQIVGTFDGIVPTGKTTLNANGTYDVSQYAQAVVAVSGITPTGTFEVTENGTYDITQYASVNIALPDGSGVAY